LASWHSQYSQPFVSILKPFSQNILHKTGSQFIWTGFSWRTWIFSS
jgi:hypothetical protein